MRWRVLALSTLLSACTLKLDFDRKYSGIDDAAQQDQSVDMKPIADYGTSKEDATSDAGTMKPEGGAPDYGTIPDTSMDAKPSADTLPETGMLDSRVDAARPDQFILDSARPDSFVQDSAPDARPDIVPDASPLNCYVNNGTLEELTILDGDWMTRDGYITQTNGAGWRVVYIDRNWDDSTLSARVRIPEDGAEKAALLFRFNPGRETGYAVTLGPEGIAIEDFGNRNIISRDEMPGNVVFQHGRWYELRVTVRNDEIFVTLDGNNVLQAFSEAHQNGVVGLGTYRGEAHFDDITAYDVNCH